MHSETLACGLFRVQVGLLLDVCPRLCVVPPCRRVVVACMLVRDLALLRIVNTVGPDDVRLQARGRGKVSAGFNSSSPCPDTNRMLVGSLGMFCLGVLDGLLLFPGQSDLREGLA